MVADRQELYKKLQSNTELCKDQVHQLQVLIIDQNTLLASLSSTFIKEFATKELDQDIRQRRGLIRQRILSHTKDVKEAHCSITEDFQDFWRQLRKVVHNAIQLQISKDKLIDFKKNFHKSN